MALPFGAAMLAATLADGQPMTTDASGAPVPDPAAEDQKPEIVPDEHIVVRGGTGELPEPGTEFSGSHGPTLEDAASGVPHGTVRQTTAGKIRAGGGTVEHKPEEAYPGGPMNNRHVNVSTGKDMGGFSEPFPNPVPKSNRIPGRPKPQ
jgi:hypothetical protein